MYKLPKRLCCLTPYQPNEGSFAVRLDANESFLPLPDALRIRVAQVVSQLDFNRYPDPMCTRLCAAFAGYYSVDPSLVVAGNGSDELIGLLVNNFLDPGECMAVTSPDFSMYGFYAQQAGSPLAVFEKPADSLVLEVDALVDFCRDKKVRLLMLSNPCNPTSLLTGRAELLQLADALPNCLVVADEAYMDFAEGSVLDAVAGRSNLVVLRTCSKALGMAAIRLGFAVCPQPLANALRAVKSPYNVNAMTQAVGELIFDEPDYLRDCARRIRQSRDSLFVSLTALAEQQEQIISIANTQANFVFVKTTCSPALFRQAAQRGVALRLMGEYLRITAGSDEENREVIVLLSRLLTEEKRETV